MILLACLALLASAGAAHAGPLATAIGVLAGTKTGALVLGIALRVGVSVAVAVWQKRNMERKLKRSQAGIRTDYTSTGGVTPLSFIVGRYATAGHMAAPQASQPANSKPPNRYLTYVIDLGDLPGVQVLRVAINNAWATITTATTSGRESFGPTLDGDFEDKVWMRVLDGTQTAADPFLLATFGADPDRPWLADMVGRGIPYVVATFKRDAKLFPGEPQIRFEVMGIPLYDPRRDSSVGGSGTQRWADRATWAPTSNPKVIEYNILRGIDVTGYGIWGGRVAAADLPLASWFAAMNECDLEVDDGAGGTEPQFVFGFEISVEMTPAEVIDEINRSCSGQTVETGGVYKTRVGGVGLPVFFFDDGDVIVTRPQELDPFNGLDETFNAVSCSHPDPELFWDAREAPPFVTPGWETADGTIEWDEVEGAFVRRPRRLLRQMTLPGVASATQVQRLIAAIARESRRQLSHVVELPPSALVLEPLDAVAWTSARNGYTAKVFEVALTADPGLELRPRIGLVEADPADHVVDPGSLTVAAAPPAADQAPAVLTVPGFAAAALALTDADGAGRRPAIRMTWTAAEAEDTPGILWELRVQATGAIAARGSTRDVAAGELILTDLIPSTAYEVHAAPETDRPFEWTDWLAVTTGELLVIRPDIAEGAVSDVYQSLLPGPQAFNAEIEFLTVTLGATSSQLMFQVLAYFEAFRIGTFDGARVQVQRRVLEDGIWGTWETLYDPSLGSSYKKREFAGLQAGGLDDVQFRMFARNAAAGATLMVRNARIVVRGVTR
jgi:hypothetical protein